MIESITLIKIRRYGMRFIELNYINYGMICSHVTETSIPCIEKKRVGVEKKSKELKPVEKRQK
jgi:hypothetical protein